MQTFFPFADNAIDVATMLLTPCLTLWRRKICFQIGFGGWGGVGRGDSHKMLKDIVRPKKAIASLHSYTATYKQMK